MKTAIVWGAVVAASFTLGVLAHGLVSAVPLDAAQTTAPSSGMQVRCPEKT